MKKKPTARRQRLSEPLEFVYFRVKRVQEKLDPDSEPYRELEGALRMMSQFGIWVELVDSGTLWFPKYRAGKGGKQGGKRRQKESAAWQKLVTAKIKRYINAGKHSNEAIGVMLALEAGRSAGHVAKYAAELRRQTARKK